MKIFDKYYDDRYEKKESISYKQLYEDNLNSECQDLILNNLTGSEEVSLYKREFFGIDKQCEEKYKLDNDTYTFIYNSEKSGRLTLIVGGIGITSIYIIIIMMEIASFFYSSKSFFGDFSNCEYGITYAIIIGCLLPIFISEAVFYFRIVGSHFTDYNCGDEMTNEIIKVEIETSTKNIILFTISFYIELTIFVLTCFAALITVFSEKIIKRLTDEPKKPIEKKKYNTDINEQSKTKSNVIPLITYSTPS